MSETSFIGVLPNESAALLKIQELKNAGYRREDIFVIKKYNDSLVIEHGLLRGVTEGEHIEDHFTDFLGGDQEVRNAFREMRFQDDEMAHYYDAVKQGNILLYVKR